MSEIDFENYFYVSNDCVLVKGHTRSSICDSTNGKYILIPNQLYDILITRNGENINQVISSLAENEEEMTVLQEYFTYLYSLNIIFLFKNRDTSLDFIPTKFERIGNQIFSSVVELNESSFKTSAIGIKYLSQMMCETLQLRITLSRDNNLISKIINLLKGTSFRYIEFIINNTFSVENKVLIDQILNQKRIQQVLIFNSKQDIESQIKWLKIVESKEQSFSNEMCGFVHQNLFLVSSHNLQLSSKHNNCLYKKVSIDQYGNIKNCLSMSKVFGNIQDGNLSQVIESKEFQKYWNISKDDIEICNQCEFRYICRDCRAYGEKEEINLSKPKKCGYDPLTAKWEKNTMVKFN